MAIAFFDLQLAFDFVSTGGFGENRAVLDRRSGEIFMRSEFLDDLDEADEFPDDVDDDVDGERYVDIPHKNELDLGKALVLDFVGEFLPGDDDAVRDMFRRRGAYRRFRALLERRGALQRWYDFSNAAEEAALRAWCADNDIELTD